MIEVRQTAEKTPDLETALHAALDWAARTQPLAQALLADAAERPRFYPANASLAAPTRERVGLVTIRLTNSRKRLTIELREGQIRALWQGPVPRDVFGAEGGR